MPEGKYTVDEAPSDQAWRMLEANPRAVLIDVRTTAEWSYVGIPDVSSLGRRPVLAEWQKFPSREIDRNFVATLERQLQERGASKDDPLLFICRSGQRSLSAAQAMAAAGYSACINVSDGFEGPRDEAGHRGTIGGWKAAGLPWSQS